MLEKIILKINKIILLGCFLLGCFFLGFFLWGQKQNQGQEWSPFLLGKAMKLSSEHSYYQSQLQEIKPSKNKKEQSKIRLTSFKDMNHQPVQLRVAFLPGIIELEEGSAYREGKLREMAQQLKSQKPDFSIFLGGLMDFSGKSKPDLNELEKLKSFLDANFGKYFIVFGEEDLTCGDPCLDAWQEVFFGIADIKNGKPRKPFYDFKNADLTFGLISSFYPQKEAMDDRQLQWLTSLIDARSEVGDSLVLVSNSLGRGFQEDFKDDCLGMKCDFFSQLSNKKNQLVIGDFSGKLIYKELAGVGFIGSVKKDPFSKQEREFLIVDFSKESYLPKAISLETGKSRVIKK